MHLPMSNFSVPLHSSFMWSGADQNLSQVKSFSSARSAHICYTERIICLSGEDQNLLTLGKWNWRECRFFERLWMLILLIPITLCIDNIIHFSISIFFHLAFCRKSKDKSSTLPRTTYWTIHRTLRSSRPATSLLMSGCVTRQSSLN